MEARVKSKSPGGGRASALRADRCRGRITNPEGFQSTGLCADVTEEECRMIKVSVMYPNTEGSTFDMAYYCETHMPLVRQKLGAALKGIVVEQGISGAAPGSPPPYLALAHLLFESLEAFQTGFAAHAQALMDDIPKFTNTQPTIQISEVKI
jgi:uncharacterized protein (TIGR02118 family)